MAPVILTSDKTNLSQFGGNKQAWPVYLTIGNISKAIQCQPLSHGSSFSEGARSNAQHRLFHQAMRTLLQPLVAAGHNSVLMTCADAKVRKIFPILAMYVTNYPEQCLVACCSENQCPKCTVWWRECRENKMSTPRTVESFKTTLECRKNGEDPVKFDLEGL